MKIENIPSMDFMYWNNCLIRLSLDSVFHLYESMGLKLTNKELFQKLLKKRINENLNQTGQYPWLKEAILETFLFDIKTELGENNYINFICFATTIFDSPSNKSWLAWRDWKNTLQETLYAEKYQTNHFVGDRLANRRKELALLYKERLFFKEQYNMLENFYDKLELTEWDKKIFDLAEFDEKSDFNDPYLQIDITMDMNNFQLFWEKHILSLPKEELNQLYEICNEINLSKNTTDKKYEFVNENDMMVDIKIPGNTYQHLQKAENMRRCVIDF